MELKIFGSVHGSNENQMQSKLDRHISGADAIFIERAANESSWTDIARTFVLNPSYTFGRLLYIANLKFEDYRNNRSWEGAHEARVLESYEENHEIETHSVDENHFVLSGDPSFKEFIVSWVGFILSGYVAYALISGSYLVFEYILGVMMMGILLSLCYVYSLNNTMSQRDSRMVSRMRNIAKNKGYNRAILIVGKEHVDGIKKRAEDSVFDHVSVINENQG